MKNKFKLFLLAAVEDWLFCVFFAAGLFLGFYFRESPMEPYEIGFVVGIFSFMWLIRIYIGYRAKIK